MKLIISIVSAALLGGLISQSVLSGEMPDEADTLLDADFSANPNGVDKLLDDAAIYVEQQAFAKAAAALERALRIEPKNPEIWHLLGQVRLHQGRYSQGVAMAQKSNSLAAGDSALQARNHHLIAVARNLASAAEAPLFADTETAAGVLDQTVADYSEQPEAEFIPPHELTDELTIEINKYKQLAAEPENTQAVRHYDDENNEEYLHLRQEPDYQLAKKGKRSQSFVSITPSHTRARTADDMTMTKPHSRKHYSYAPRTQLPARIDINVLYGNLSRSMAGFRLERPYRNGPVGGKIRHKKFIKRIRGIPAKHLSRKSARSLPSYQLSNRPYIPFVSPR